MSINQAIADRLTGCDLDPYVVEYDENSIAWLVHLTTNVRWPLVHGMLLRVGEELGTDGGDGQSGDCGSLDRA